jgi:hypothetical protein
VWGADESYIADIAGPAEVQEGNAYLIGAALEMYEGLEAAVLELTTVGQGHGHSHSKEVIDRLLAIIARAEGR